jgi:aspergillopepsin I
MGRAWKDTVTVGDIVIPDAVVESAVQVSPSMAQDLVMGGIFGLAYGLESEVHPRQPTVLKTMSPLLEYKIFSTDLQYHADGTYQFGSVDTTKYRGRINWTPLIPRAKYWQFNFSGLNVAPSNLWYYSQWTAIADTGTTLLMLEDELVEFYYADVHHAEKNETTGIWTYPCQTILPDFNLVIGNFTARIPGKYINYTEYEGSLCMGGLQGNFGSPFAILGDIFLKALYVVWDIGGKRLGFADKPLHL